ncbi:MAG: PKD domain-containing protein [Bacteroidales bacterium]|nr:PKD domain-containing protein [Bacteroidales bacterium]
MVKNFSLSGVRLFILTVGFTLLYLPFQAQQLTRFNPDTQSLMIDLTEITSLITRAEVYDFLKSNNDIGIMPFDNASKVIVSSNVLSQKELQSYYEAAVERFSRDNESLSKESQTVVLTDFAAKYGFTTTDHLMRSVTDTENDSCHNSLPFCTDLIYNFPAGVGSGEGQNGPNYGCLGSTPNPAWYHMKIAIAGSLTIKMFSTPQRDIDFILWGPFDDPVTPCAGGLTANKIIDCSYSTAATEFCDISNGILGKYYILLITNFSNNPCNITFQKTGGVGATDCTIVPPPIDSNSPLCYGEDILLTADDFAGATYAWSGPNGWSSNQQNPVIPNAELSDSGLYSLVITVGGSSSDPISLNVVVNAVPIPQFTGENVCFGEVTHFTNQSTTNPAGESITSRLWNFGDGQTSALENPTHTYASAGNFTVTLTCYTGMFNCQETISHVVVVNAMPVPAFSAEAVCFGEETVFVNESTTNPAGQTITGYLWDFGDGVTSTLENPTHTYTDPDVYTVTLTCSTGMNNCEQSVTHDVALNTVPVPAFTTENVCFGEVTHFTNQSETNPPGETITSYLWDFGDDVTSTLENPTHSFANPGTYNVTLTCYTGDHSCEQSISHTAIASEYPETNAGDDQSIPSGWTTNLDGSVGGGSGSLTYIWSPAEFLINPNVLNPTTISLTQSQQYTLTTTDQVTGCVSSDQMTVNVTGGSLYVQATATPNVLCKGESTGLFAYASGGAGSYTYSWTSDPAGFTSNIADPSVSPLVTTIYYVAVFDGQVTVNSTVTVNVKQFPIAVAGNDKTINIGTATTLYGSTFGGSGNHTFVWSPADSLSNPTTSQFEQNPLTKLLYDTINQTVYTLIIQDENGCVSEPDNVVVTVGGELLSVFANAEKDVLCYGESTTITASPAGGGNNYTYLWSSNIGGFTSDQSIVNVQPNETTTYTVNVTDEFGLHASNSVQIVVNTLPVVELKPANINWYKTDTINVCVRDSVWLDAGPNMEYLWNNGSTDQRVKALTNGVWVDFQTYSVLVSNPVTGCQSSDIITLFFDFTACNLGIDDKSDVSSNLKLGPNPTKGVFTVELGNINEDGNISIGNTNGTVLEERPISMNGLKPIISIFDLTPYPKGVYLIWFSSKSYRAVKQIIKN